MAVIEAAKRLLIAMGHGAEQRRVIQLGDIVAHTRGRSTTVTASLSQRQARTVPPSPHDNVNDRARREHH